MNKKLLISLGTIVTITAPIAAVVSCGDSKAKASVPDKTKGETPDSTPSKPDTGEHPDLGNSLNYVDFNSDKYFDDGLYRSKRPMNEYDSDTRPSHSFKSTARDIINSDNQYTLEYFKKYDSKTDYTTSPYTSVKGYGVSTYYVNGMGTPFTFNIFEVYDYRVEHHWNGAKYISSN